MWSYVVVQFITILLLAPLVNGIVTKIKALSQKRKGAPVFQMYFDLYKLFRKGTVVSEASSWIFKATPYIVFSSSLIAALFVPVSTKISTGCFMTDGIMFVYVLALGRFFLMLAGLDTGSTFGGMGSSREGMISSLIEPSIIVSIFTIGLISKSTSIYQMIHVATYIKNPVIDPVYIVVFIAMMIVLIAETARIPIDDPSTHLELTMVHEAMLLEYSGRYLALMEWGSVIKQLVLITFIVNVFFPVDQLIGLSGYFAIIQSVFFYIIKVILLSVLIGVIEINTVKMRLFSIPNLAVISFILAILGFANSFIMGL